MHTSLITKIRHRTIIERYRKCYWRDLLRGHASDSHIPLAYLLSSLQVKHLARERFDIHRDDTRASVNIERHGSIEGERDGLLIESSVGR